MFKKIKSARSLLFLLVYFIASNALVFLLPFDLFTVDSLAPINSVEFVESSAKQPQEITSSAWLPIKLPDFWYSNHQQAVSIWYQTQTQITDLSEPIWAVYLPSLTHNAAVFINDDWVGQGGQFEPSVSRHHNEPLLFKFSSDRLHLGLNKINVRIKSSNGSQGLLGQFYLAPATALQNSFELKHLLRVDFIQWLTISMFVYAGLTLLFFIARPNDTVYGYFSALIFFWAMHNLNLFINHIPVSASLWEAMTVSTLGWAVVMMIMFNHRYLGSINRRVELFILTFSIAGLGIFFIPDTVQILDFGYRVWDSFLIIIGIYAQYYLLHVYIHQQNKDAYFLTLIGIPLLVLGLHDILVVNHFIDAQEGLIIQFSIIPTFMVFSWFLIRRFLQSLNDAEQLAVTLERRVEEKQKSLEIQYKQINAFLKNKRY